MTILDVQAEVFPYYMAADIVVMPSVMEPFGLVTCEAMAFSKPVIGSNIGGISEVIVHKETGELLLTNSYMYFIRLDKEIDTGRDTEF